MLIVRKVARMKTNCADLTASRYEDPKVSEIIMNRLLE
jgi:hypothetical protein